MVDVGVFDHRGQSRLDVLALELPFDVLRPQVLELLGGESCLTRFLALHFPALSLMCADGTTVCRGLRLGCDGVSTLTIAGPILAQRSVWVRRETDLLRTALPPYCYRGSRFGASRSAWQPGRYPFRSHFQAEAGHEHAAELRIHLRTSERMRAVAREMRCWAAVPYSIV